MLMRRRTGLTAVALIGLLIAPQIAWSQRPAPQLPVLGHTLMQGSGYVATPHALVAKGSLYVTGTAVAPESYAFLDGTTDAYTLTRLSAGLALGGFIEVGGTAGSPDGFSFFGKLQVAKQNGAFPSLAVGVQNLTTADFGRYGIEDVYYDDPWDAASIYAVFTYVAGPGRTRFPSWVTISGGWGTGLFYEDNPQIEGTDRSSGLFGAVSLDFQAGDDAFLRFMGEWDGFDINVGAMAALSGIEFTVGALSLGKGEREAPDPDDPLDPTTTFAGQFYNQIKPFVSVTFDMRALGAIPWVWTKGEE
jgi:hypothetical protein